MLPGVTGPSQQHLQEMANVFRGGLPHPEEDATPDGKHRVSHSGAEISYDGKVISDTYDATQAYDPQGRLASPFPDDPALPVTEALPRTVTVAPDGGFVLFTVPDPSLIVAGEPRTLIVQKEKTGLIFKSFSSPPVICFDLDSPPASLDISPVDRSLAIAWKNQVAECSTQHETRMRVEVPETLADAEYLSDGSLALCTERQEDGYHYYFVAADSMQAVPVALQDFDPRALREQQVEGLKPLGVKDGDLDAFRQQNPSLFNANGTVVPYAWLESPKDPRHVLVLVPGAVVAMRLYDVETHQGSALGQLEGIPFSHLTMAWEQDGRMLAAWDQKVERTAVHVVDTQDGHETVLADVGKVSYDTKTLELCFTPPSIDGKSEGAPTRISMKDVSRLTGEPWYQGAHDRYLKKLQDQLMPDGKAADAQPKTTAPVEVADSYITVNGIRVPRKAS